MSLDDFYQSILKRLQEQHVSCAITGGLACVQFGVAEHTEDCDLICAPEGAHQLLDILELARFGDTHAVYRGNLSAPLDPRWLQGGWTSHFTWETHAPIQPYLDVFGVPPRMSSPWLKEIQGFWAGPHTVAEMKRTNRRKDWDQATALGLRMLRSGDERGWLHIFDADALLSLSETMPIQTALLAQRPVLRLAAERSPRLARAIQTEVDFWTHLNRLRLKIYENAARPYAAAVRDSPGASHKNLSEQHALRLAHAEKLLPTSPLHDYGVDRLIHEAQIETGQDLNPELLQHLPDARLCLRCLC
ncbi:MAG: hypothetical protein ACOYMV_11970 [Verrucomicrobiia bacterium]